MEATGEPYSVAARRIDEQTTPAVADAAPTGDTPTQ
jgi:hypothetical protein